MKNTHEIKGNVVKVTVPYKDGENFIFTIDLDDLPIVDSKASWSMDKNKTSAVANFREEGKMCKATMHRLLTGWKNVNFADEDRFNLRRSNMIEAEQRKRRRKAGQHLKGNEYIVHQDYAEMIIDGKSSGKVLIDCDDLFLVSNYTWNINPSNGYVQTKTREGRGKSQAIYLHRLIMGEKCDGTKVDHIDGIRLNNRKNNLRTCSNSQNLHNIKTTWHPNERKFRGVTVARYCYVAQIQIDGKRYRECFSTFEDAMKQRLKWEKEFNPSGL